MQEPKRSNEKNSLGKVCACAEKNVFVSDNLDWKSKVFLRLFNYRHRHHHRHHHKPRFEIGDSWLRIRCVNLVCAIFLSICRKNVLHFFFFRRFLFLISFVNSYLRLHLCFADRIFCARIWNQTHEQLTHSKYREKVYFNEI